MNHLAFDIGGANIKVADGLGYAASYPFQLWREPALLATKLQAAIRAAPVSDSVAITMTGELADCFESKAEGVRHIIQSVEQAAADLPTRVYLCDGRLVAPQVAIREPLLAAASNWHALACYCGRFAPMGPALLIDIGSTTCDIIPLSNGLPVPTGRTDTTRLLSGELVYTGVERSPVCAVIDRVAYRGRECPVAQELFATMLDVYLVLEQIPERPSDMNAADGKPAIKSAACARLARVIAADGEEFGFEDAVALAESAAAAQRDCILSATVQVLKRLGTPPATYILSGHGEFLAARALERLPAASNIVRLAKELGPAVSRCAPAHAVAVLAREVLEQ